MMMRLCLLMSLGAALFAGDAPTTTITDGPYSASIAGEIIHTNEMDIGSLKLTDVVSRPEFRDNVLTFHECQARVFGGIARGTLTIDFTAKTVRIVANVEQAALSTLLSAYGGNAEAYSGLINGEIDLSFPLNKLEDASGRGSLKISNGNLIELSFLINLLVGDVSNVRDQDTAEANFEINAGTIRLSSARVVMPKGILLISGTILFDGSLRLLVIPRLSGGLLGQVWFVGKWFGSAMAFASSHVARAVVRGTLSRPVVVINPFAQ
jgi:AsmA-like C-terminal region